MAVADLDLELDVFAGPFDLLLAVVLREEVDLLEVELAEVVVAYVEHLEREGELELEVATEFLVLIAALLELKSRLLLPGAEEEIEELGPEEAVEELLARLLEYRRYRDAAAMLAERFEAARGYLYRAAPLPPELRRVAVEAATAVYDPERLGAALGDLLAMPPPLDVSHIRPTVSLERRLRALRDALSGRASIDFDEQFGGEDRLTQAVTLFALLELYRKGEVTWKQSEPLGPDRDPQGRGRQRERPAAHDRGAALPLAAAGRRPPTWPRRPRRPRARSPRRSSVLREDLAEGRRGVVLREVAGGFALASDPGSEEAARRLLAKPRTPPLTQAQAETLAIVAYLQPVSRPEVARIRGVSSESAVQTLAERGLIEESGRSQLRRGDLQDDGAVRAALRPRRARPAAGPVAQFDPTPEDERELRERLLKAGEQRADAE